MNWKTIGFTVFATLMVLASIGAAMAAFTVGAATITVPDGQVAIYYLMPTTEAIELRDAFCLVYDYQEKVLDDTLGVIDNPESYADFADRMNKRHGRDVLMTARAMQAPPPDLGAEPTITD